MDHTRLAHELRENARKLELQVALTRLLKRLFQESDRITRFPGRYRFLEEAIEQRPQFLQALLEGNDESIQSEWLQLLPTYQSDVRFLHGLAVTYWEHALADLTERADAGRYWVLSTALWALLLVSKAFWTYFFATRSTNDSKEAGSPTAIKQQEELLHNALETILSLHSTYGGQDFAAGRYKQARIHLGCLDLCRSGDQALVAALKQRGVPCTLDVDKKRLEWLIEQAKKLLDDWCATLVGEAEKITTDAEAIKRLPQGIRKNYEGGIRHLERFTEWRIPVGRVLTTSLDWYNDWCYDLYVTKNVSRIKQLMRPARTLTEQLIPLCMKGIAYRQENQVLSQHFLLRGFTNDEPEQAIKEYEEALAWNPANSNAEKLIGDSYQELLMKQLKVAVDHVEHKRFTEAYQVLAAIEQKAKDKTQIREAHAAVCFRHANVLAEEGKFREALTRAREAKQLHPTEPTIQEFVTLLTELAPEEDNLRHLRSAKEAYERDRYDQAIQSASQVSPNSQFYSQSRRLLSAAHFHRGVDAVNRSPNIISIIQAEADLEKALSLNEDRKERKLIQEQLNVLRTISRRIHGY